MAATKRAFEQGPHGGWRVVGSGRIVNGKMVYDYVPADVALRAQAGKATEQEVAAAISSRSEPESKKRQAADTAKPPEQTTTPESDVAGGESRSNKSRDPRLPQPGTEIKGVGRNKIYSMKESKDGVFTLYRKGQEVAQGHSLTAAWIQYKQRPGSAFSAFGLNKQDQAGTMDKETGLTLYGKRDAGERPEWLPDIGTKITVPGGGYVIERADNVFIKYTDKGTPEIAAYSLNEIKRQILGPKSNKNTAVFFGLKETPSRKRAPKPEDPAPERGATERKPRKPRGERKIPIKKESQPPKQASDRQQPTAKPKRRKLTPEERKQRDKQRAEKKESAAEFYTSIHFSRKLRGKYKALGLKKIGVDKGGWKGIKVKFPGDREFIIKTKAGAKNAWAIENKPGAKPFRMSEAAIKSKLKTERIPQAEKQKAAAKNIQKAIDIGNSQYITSAFDVYTDGVVIRGKTGGLVGFVPIDLQGEPLDCVIKHLPDDIPSNVRVNFAETPRVSSAEDNAWHYDLESRRYKTTYSPQISKSVGVGIPSAFCFSQESNCYLGAGDADALYNAMGVISKAVDTKPVDNKPKPRKGYPKRLEDYADRTSYRYPIDTEAHVRAALSYFGNPKYREKYTADQQKEISRRIVSAAKRFGIDVSPDSEVGRLAGIKE